jgi:hypothetical protein
VSIDVTQQQLNSIEVIVVWSGRQKTKNSHQIYLVHVSHHITIYLFDRIRLLNPHISLLRSNQYIPAHIPPRSTWYTVFNILTRINRIVVYLMMK